jgi:hypothetical protein
MLIFLCVYISCLSIQVIAVRSPLILTRMPPASNFSLLLSEPLAFLYGLCGNTTSVNSSYGRLLTKSGTELKLSI